MDRKQTARTMRKECSSDVSSPSFGGALRDIQKRLRGRLSESVTLFKAVSEKVIQDVAMCANILKQTCEILMFIHERGFLHNDLKSNNVVIDGSENKPVIIDFGKSCKIVKARLRKVNTEIDQQISTHRTGNTSR